MKNLKRILSLALASVMVMGMMVVGASAAFNDQADINAGNVNAVNTMVALGVISGKEGNQFDPKGNVTRAEMATMIAMSLNGGNADFRGTTTTGFTDVDGVASIKWAAKFIKYCVDQGILSGVGGGKFNPNANVTAQEAATMVLTAMGYKKEMLKSETSDWAAKINLKAEQRDLYEDTTITDYTQTIDRQTAAQMIYNGITVGTPIVRDTYNTTTGEHEYSVTSEAGNPSILTTAFKAHMEYAVLTGTAYNAKTGKFTYTMDSSDVTVDPLAGSRGADGKPNGAEGLTLTSEVDVSDLFMQKVKVIYSDSNDKVTKDTVVIGITSISDCVLSTGTVGKMKINAAGTTIDGFGTVTGTSTIPTYGFNSGEYAKKGWEAYTLIDNNDDGKADCMVINPVVVAKVTGKSSTILTTTEGRYAYEENAIADGLAIGDWVTIKATGVKEDNVIEALEPIENVTATVKTAKDIYTIGGESYRAASWTGKAFNNTTNAELKEVELGKAYTLVALNGYVFNAEEYDDGTSVGINDVLLVTAVAKDVNTGADTEVSKGTAYHEVNAVFTDGKSQPIKVSKIYDATANGGKGGYANVSASNKVSGTEALYSFTVDANGYYRIKALPTTNNDPWERYTAKTIADGETVKDGKTSGTNVVRFDNNAVVFVKAEGILDENGNTTYRVVNGAEVNKWNEAAGTELDAGLAYTKTVSGFPYAGLAFLTLEATKDIWPMGTSGLKYGYLTAATVEAYDAATKASVAQLTIWNGEEEVTRTATLGDDGVVTALSAYPAGKLISYKETSDGQLSELNDLTETTLGTWEANKANAGVVLAYNNGTDIQVAPSQIKHLGTPTEAPKLTAKEFDMDANETVVIFIDQAEGEGVASGAITLADLDGDNDYINNVYAVVDKTDSSAKLLALFVEVNNEAKAQMATSEVKTVGIKGDTAAESIVVTVTGDTKEDNTITVTAVCGASLTYTGKVVKCTVSHNGAEITATAVAGNPAKGAGTYKWTFDAPAFVTDKEITVTITLENE